MFNSVPYLVRDPHDLKEPQYNNATFRHDEYIIPQVLILKSIYMHARYCLVWSSRNDYISTDNMERRIFRYIKWHRNR